MSIKTYLRQLKPAYDIPWDRRGKFFDRPTERCRYCASKRIVKRGRRPIKHETIQLYQCKACEKTFTPKIIKGKHYPLKVIFDAISYFNLGHNKTDTCRLIKEKYGSPIGIDALTRWIDELLPLCTYHRLRPALQPRYHPTGIIQSTILHHKQPYHFRYHQAKLDHHLSRGHFVDPKFQGVKNYLESVRDNCPHHYFRTDSRSSQTKADLDFGRVHVARKENHATRLALLLLQAVTDNKFRHDSLQQFMLINDFATIAMEVPVYLKPKDLKQYFVNHGFDIPLPANKTITGHIDLLQLRRPYVYILDYKPRAQNQKPYTQLLIYALALSKLTGLKLKDFKCAWFDENNYFEFFPLQLVHKRFR